jgi:cytoskeletal protein RodZ
METAKKTKGSKTPKKTTGNAKAPKAEAKKAPAPKTAAKAKVRDERLPAAGTVLTKRTREGKTVTCTVLADGGAEYKGQTYRTLSAAARAAAADLKIFAISQNGFLFWGVMKQPRAAAK